MTMIMFLEFMPLYMTKCTQQLFINNYLHCLYYSVNLTTEKLYMSPLFLNIYLEVVPGK